jgi:RNA polymerase sigma-70 factor (ECF subfamily)
LWDPAEVEDMVQESFLRLHRHLREGQPIGNAKAWLFRVGHNLCVDRGRRTRDADSLSQPSVSKAAEDMHARSIPTPEERLVEREQRQRLARAVATLPSQQRQCMHLRREGFRYREIGQILGIRESTVIDHMRRAIERLSKELHDSR